MAHRNLSDKLIPLEQINEELRLIKGSSTDYVAPTGNIYKDYMVIISFIIKQLS